MSEFDLELIEVWLESAEFWLSRCSAFPWEPLCLKGFADSMDALRKFWPTHE